MANIVTAGDSRLKTFEGDSILLSTGQSLIGYVDSITEFNAKYLVEEDSTSEYGTLWKQISYTRSVADEPTEDTDPADVKSAQQLMKAVEDSQAKLSLARNQSAAWAAKQLGISVATERPEIPKGELEQMKSFVREPAVSLANTLMVLATALKSMDEGKSSAITAFLAEHPIPQIGRKGQLDVTEIKAQAPKYRVDVSATGADGTVIFKVAGFTKAAAQKNTPSADQFRGAYEANETQNTQFEHNGVTYSIKNRK